MNSSVVEHSEEVESLTPEALDFRDDGDWPSRSSLPAPASKSSALVDVGCCPDFCGLVLALPLPDEPKNPNQPDLMAIVILNIWHFLN